MSVSVRQHDVPCANQDLGGRPVDPAVQAFEGCFEALVALRDDQKAIEHTVHGLSEMRRCVARLEAHLEQRVRRLASTCIPEVAAATQLLDARLTRATLTRRVAARSARKAEAAS